MTYNKSIFKWAGGKGKALKHILPILEKHRRGVFIEPFVGAANVSLNFEANKYIWNDINSDLIDTYWLLLRSVKDKDNYINNCQRLFDRGYKDYYIIREELNQKHRNLDERVSRFQYVNKLGYNGLCRYNSMGYFNVPMGTIKNSIPTVPVEAINLLSNRHRGNTQLWSESYSKMFEVAEKLISCLIYCDPPYVALKSDFKYDAKGFDLNEHLNLKKLAKESKHTTIISNHWTNFTKELYKDADEIYTFPVQRTISCDKGTRNKVEEVVAVYYGNKP